jgi:hypothetical protein
MLQAACPFHGAPTFFAGLHIALLDAPAPGGDALVAIQDWLGFSLHAGALKETSTAALPPVFRVILGVQERGRGVRGPAPLTVL